VKRGIVLALTGLVVSTSYALTSALAASAKTVAVSVTASGPTTRDDENELGSLSPVISASGRRVAFYSFSDGLVPGDTNHAGDVFVRDVRARTTTRVSVNSRGGQLADGASHPAISGNGHLIAFWSFSNGVVPGDTNMTRCFGDDFDEECQREPAGDVFVRDVPRGTTRRVSVSSSGRQGNDSSELPAISANGRFVGFSSSASNLVRRDRSRRVSDIFVRDLRRGTTRLISVSSAEQQGNADSFGVKLSASGRYAAFASEASNLVADDTNGHEDLFVRDLRRGVTRRVSVSSEGMQADAEPLSFELSGDGRYVVFNSAASNLVSGDTNRPSDPEARASGADVFVHDLRRRTTWRVSVSEAGTQGDGDSYNPTLSDNGRYVAFASEAQNLLPGRDVNGFLMDVFVRDLRRDRLRRVSVSSQGRQGNSYSAEPALTANGHAIVFESDASNLVARDRNGVPDVFLRRPIG
jgi:Tol biopolymer transport system component